jgi:hypothetical protein
LPVVQVALTNGKKSDQNSSNYLHNNRPSSTCSLPVAGFNLKDPADNVVALGAHSQDAGLLMICDHHGSFEFKLTKKKLIFSVALAITGMMKLET